ncbi:helix-turn-helix transcriptional regulator [Streptomyces sp. NPDC048442]|uniref:helix-turn-helix transcriptional regulator n=1 Tax=Streptomyces sp. NPDC048442 TaxID=3154823 RepID=UPI0034486E2A
MDRAELAHFLRDRRARLKPVSVGLVAGGRRRTPGLRREEIAQLAGISPDYYMRLEQARGPRPSRQVLKSLAWALQLSDDERNYLFRLTGEAPALAGASREVPANVLMLLERLDDNPAMVLDAKYDILAWNRMATALMCDFDALPAGERNTLRWLFGRQRAWLETADGWRYARQCVADLRATGRYPEDPAVRDFVDQLHAESPQFARLWDAREIEIQRSTTKRSVHPVVGELELDCEILVLPDRDQRLIFYTAALGSPSHKALQALRAGLDPC